MLTHSNISASLATQHQEMRNEFNKSFNDFDKKFNALRQKARDNFNDFDKEFDDMRQKTHDNFTKAENEFKNLRENKNIKINNDNLQLKQNEQVNAEQSHGNILTFAEVKRYGKIHDHFMNTLNDGENLWRAHEINSPGDDVKAFIFLGTPHDKSYEKERFVYFEYNTEKSKNNTDIKDINSFYKINFSDVGKDNSFYESILSQNNEEICVEFYTEPNCSVDLKKSHNFLKICQVDKQKFIVFTYLVSSKNLSDNEKRLILAKIDQTCVGCKEIGF